MCSPSGLFDLARKTTHLLEKERTTAIIMELFTIIIIIVIILTRRWPTVLWSNDVAHFISTILLGVNTIATFLTIQVLLKQILKPKCGCIFIVFTSRFRRAGQNVGQSFLIASQKTLVLNLLEISLIFKTSCFSGDSS